MIGKPYVRLPVASIRIIVREIVIRTTPPNIAAAPSSAYFPCCVAKYSGKTLARTVPNNLPQAAPVNRVGMKTPAEMLSP